MSILRLKNNQSKELRVIPYKHLSYDQTLISSLRKSSTFKVIPLPHNLFPNFIKFFHFSFSVSPSTIFKIIKTFLLINP